MILERISFDITRAGYSRRLDPEMLIQDRHKHDIPLAQSINQGRAHRQKGDGQPFPSLVTLGGTARGMRRETGAMWDMQEM